MRKKHFLTLIIFSTLFFITSCDISLPKTTIKYDKRNIESNETWHENEIIEIDHTVYVKANLTIEKCAEIHFMNNSSIIVQNNGTIKTKGTSSCPVKITSGKSSPSAGDWKQIVIKETASSGNEFNNTIFEYGGNSYYGMVEIEKGPSVSFKNCTFKYSNSQGLYFDNGANVTTVSGAKFYNIKGNLIETNIQTAGAIEKIETSKDNKMPTIKIKGTMDEDVNLKNAGVPYLATNTIYVKAKLTIDSGATIKMDNNTFSIQNNGLIVSNGTKDAPVIFTSSKSVPSSGDWKQIVIDETASSGNLFNYTIFEYGGDSYYGMVEIGKGPETTFTNCIFSYSDSYGLYLDKGAKINNFEGNSFDHIKENIVTGNFDSFYNFKPIKTDSKTNKDNSVLVKGTLTNDILLRNLTVPYFANNSLYVKAKLEIEAGTIFQMDNNTLYVQDNGIFKTLGKSGNRVIFTSHKSVPSPGDWKNIVIEDTAGNGHELNFTTIEYGGGGYYGQFEIDGNQTVTMNNVKFLNTEKCDIYQGKNAVLNDTDSEYKLCK